VKVVKYTIFTMGHLIKKNLVTSHLHYEIRQKLNNPSTTKVIHKHHLRAMIITQIRQDRYEGT